MAACTHNRPPLRRPRLLRARRPALHPPHLHSRQVPRHRTRQQQQKPHAIAHASTIPRDQPYGLKSFPEIGTHLAAIGDWRATVTEYDWEYVEQVQSGSGNGGGGHVTGGTLSLLYHQHARPALHRQHDAVPDHRDQQPAGPPRHAAHGTHPAHRTASPPQKPTPAPATSPRPSPPPPLLPVSPSKPAADSSPPAHQTLTHRRRPLPASPTTSPLPVVEIIASHRRDRLDFILPIIAQQDETVDATRPADHPHHQTIRHPHHHHRPRHRLRPHPAATHLQPGPRLRVRSADCPDLRWRRDSDSTRSVARRRHSTTGSSTKLACPAA